MHNPNSGDNAMSQNKLIISFRSGASWRWKFKFIQVLVWIIQDESTWSRIWRIIRFNHSLTLSKNGLARALQSDNVNSSHCICITSHAYTHTYALCLNFDRVQVFGFTPTEWRTKVISIQELNLSRNPTEHEGSFQKKLHSRTF